MTNSSTPFGFLDTGLTEGISPNFGVYLGSLGSANAHSIYRGDVASVLAAGLYDVATVVGGGGPIGGIFVDFEWPSVSAGMTVRTRAWLGNTADIASGGVVSCRVAFNPQARFRVRSNGIAITSASIGRNINFATGSTPGNNLVSTMSVDPTTIADNPSLPFKIYAIDPNPPSDPTSSYNTIIVGFSNLQAP